MLLGLCSWSVTNSFRYHENHWVPPGGRCTPVQWHQERKPSTTAAERLARCQKNIPFSPVEISRRSQCTYLERGGCAVAALWKMAPDRRQSSNKVWNPFRKSTGKQRRHRRQPEQSHSKLPVSKKSQGSLAVPNGYKSPSIWLFTRLSRCNSKPPPRWQPDQSNR